MGENNFFKLSKEIDYTDPFYSDEETLGFNKFFKVLNEFESVDQAKAVLKIGTDNRANIIARIPDTAYYQKVCVSPRCGRKFEATIRGLYCSYAPRGKGSSCRQHIFRLKILAKRYLFANDLVWIVSFLLLSYVLYNNSE